MLTSYTQTQRTWQRPCGIRIKSEEACIAKTALLHESVRVPRRVLDVHRHCVVPNLCNLAPSLKLARALTCAPVWFVTMQYLCTSRTPLLCELHVLCMAAERVTDRREARKVNALVRVHVSLSKVRVHA